MAKLLLNVLTVLVSLSTAAGLSVAQANDFSIYVSPAGSDSNPGTIWQPLQSPQQAQILANSVKANINGDVIVNFRGGRYELKTPWIFGSGDSGVNAHKIIYRSAPGELAQISGGRRLTAHWQNYQSGIFVTHIGTLSSAGIQPFRQLYVNHHAAILARYPNLNPSDTWPGGFNQISGFTTTKTGKFGNSFKPKLSADVSAKILAMTDRSQLEMNFTWKWAQAIIHPTQSDGSTLGYAAGYFAANDVRPSANIKYFILQNALDLLDAPGEWYYDTTGGNLYYYPKNGEDIESANIVIPQLETALQVNGSPSLPVSDIEFDQLLFENTNWSRPSTDKYYIGLQETLFFTFSTTAQDPGSDFSPAGVQINFGSRIAFNGNVFQNMGATGFLAKNSTGVVAVNNTFQWLAGSAVQLGGNGGKPLDISPCSQCVISNNLIDHVATEYWGNPGIAAYKVGNSTQINQNEIRFLPYTGIITGTANDLVPLNGASRSQVNFNHIHHVMQLLNDGGAIYTWSPACTNAASCKGHASGTPPQPLANSYYSQVNNNYIHDLVKSKWVVAGTLTSIRALYFDLKSTYFWAANNYYVNMPTENSVKPTIILTNNGASPTATIAQAGLTSANHAVIDVMIQRANQLTDSPTPYALKSAATNSALPGWPVANVLADNRNSCYSSNYITPRVLTSNNPGGIYIAAWFMNAPVSVNEIDVVNRTDQATGQAMAYGAAYQVFVTNAANSAWDYVGDYSVMPTASDQITRIKLNAPTGPTHGVMLVPQLLVFPDYRTNDNAFFQMCGLRVM